MQHSCTMPQGPILMTRLVKPKPKNSLGGPEPRGPRRLGNRSLTHPDFFWEHHEFLWKPLAVGRHLKAVWSLLKAVGKRLKGSVKKLKGSGKKLKGFGNNLKVLGMTEGVGEK